MKNELTLETARNLDTAALLQLLVAGLTVAADGILRASMAVCILKERGVYLPKLPEVYDFASHIADGRLSPRAAMTLARFPFTVQSVLDLPHDMQDRLADGEKIKIAVKVNGRIQSAERSIWEMSAIQMRLAFTDGKVVPWEEQGEWLHKTGYVDAAPVKRVTVKADKKTGEIVVGRARIAVEDLQQPLLDLGFVISKAYKAKMPKAVATTTS